MKLSAPFPYGVLKSLLSLLSFAPWLVRGIRSPPVKTWVQAGWEEPHILLQILETVTLESPEAFFPFVDLLTAPSSRLSYPEVGSLTPQEVYEIAFETLASQNELFRVGDLDSIRLSLAVGEASPRVEAFYQLYNTVLPQSLSKEGEKCESWIDWYGEKCCDESTFQEVAIDKGYRIAKRSNGTSYYPFDHVRGLDSASPTAILYADPLSSNFANLHQLLSSLSLSKSTESAPLRYIMRWKPFTLTKRPKPLPLAGYGAGLDIKKAEYLAIDDRRSKSSEHANSVLNENAKVWQSDDSAFDQSDEAISELTPLSKADLEDLGDKAVQFIMKSSKPLSSLIELSQNFPRYAHDLATKWVTSVEEDLEAELRQNRLHKVEAGRSLAWINGLQISFQDFDTFSLLRIIRSERRRIQSLVASGLSPSQAANIIMHPAISDLQGAGPNPRGLITADAMGQFFDSSDRTEGSKAIFWWNDVAKDRRYAQWPLTLKELTRPRYPGQLPAIARNLFNAVFILDLSKTTSYVILSELVLGYITRGLPIHFGFVPLLISEAGKSEDAGLTAALAIFYVATELSKADAMTMIKELGHSSSPMISLKEIKKVFENVVAQKTTKSGASPLSFETLIESSSNEYTIQAEAYCSRLGIQRDQEIPGYVFFNGRYIAFDNDFQNHFQESLTMQMQFLQQKVYMDELTDEDDAENFFYDLPRTFKTRNAYTFPSTAQPLKIVDVTELLSAGFSYGTSAFVHSTNDSSTQLMSTVYVIADLDSNSGRGLAQTLLEYLTNSSGFRLCMIHNPKVANEDSSRPAFTLYSAWLHSKLDSPEAVMSLFRDLESSVVASDEQMRPEFGQFWTQSRSFTSQLGLQPGENGLVVNGRVIGPLPDGAFRLQDFEGLFQYETQTRIGPTALAIQSALTEFDSLSAEKRADILATATAVLGSAQIVDSAAGLFDTVNTKRSRDYQLLESNYTMISLGNNATAWLHFGIILDPISETGQKWASILATLAELPGCYVEIHLNPLSRLEELPIKRFYRHNFKPSLTFDDNGSPNVPALTFRGLPTSILLTMAMDVPHAWLAFPSKSIYDLDNIRLSDLSTEDQNQGLQAIFTLESIIVEGHARDMPTGQPPRGLQLILASQDEVYKTDSLVMANLGYFQLKANPGVWQLSIRSGRSSEVFYMESVGATGFKSETVDKTGFDLFVTTLEGSTIYPRFKRHIGMESVDLLDENSSAESSSAAGVFNKYMGAVQHFFGGKETKSAPPALKMINIFTVASGLLYERMAFIMIISVLRHTSNPCKFWFIQNFLSPSFKAFIPHMAKEYGFEYELVTYKWPHWLRSQKEKQRTIWGYKILFLDVLFPLELDRVIFVDSDQIVRTDLKQLLEMDLQGAPYAFTPMGDDREEMEGYRFWKTGYWKTHLAGRPYHISALYAVDLDRFRAVAAGDRLRAQYQGLSSDPNSLANLDQDLPNNMQHSIPIHTLDQSWLWCETWCSDESLAQAKTIDLCNNPETHEPKLARAKRLVPEWTVYDNEVAALAKRVADVEAGNAFASDASNLEQAKLQLKEFVEEGSGSTTGEKLATDEILDETIVTSAGLDEAKIKDEL